MASTWYINDTDLATLGVTDLKIKFCNRADDVATWTCDGKALDSVASFATGTGITIKKGSSSVFRGVLTSLPRYGTGTGQRISYEARGGWYFLGKVFYTQKWPKSVSGLLHSKTRVVLGYEGNDSGTHGQQCSASRQLKDIVTVAHNKAASHIAGSTSYIDVSSIKLPADEEVDLTCADAINRVLRWFPDTVVWFDHTQSPPVCHMKRRADISDIQYLSAANAEEVELTPRDDLVVPGVSIDYEITSASSNKTYKDVQTDSANAGNPSALGAAHFTVQLDGGSSHYLWQSVTSEALPSTRPAATVAGMTAWGNFIQQYIPELDRTGTFEDFSLVSPDVWPPRYQVPGTQTHKILDHVLLRGEIQPWMADKYAAETRLEFKASYTDGDGNTYVDRKFRVTLALTNCQSGIYNFRENVTPAEEVPEGLAKAIYDAVGTLYHEGRAVVVDDDPPDIASPGQKLSISGVLPSGSAVCLVQSAEWDVGRGRSTVSFGPPQHVGVQDLVELAQANRKRKSSVSAGSYKTSEVTRTEQSIGGVGANTIAGSLVEGTFAKRVLKVDVEEEGGGEATRSGEPVSNTVTKTLVFDPAAIPEVYSVISDITPELDASGNTLRLILHLTRLNITKVSNAIQSIVPDEPEEDGEDEGEGDGESGGEYTVECEISGRECPSGGSGGQNGQGGQ